MTRRRTADRSGMTLIEILVAVTLLGILSVGLVTALQVTAGAWSSARNTRSQDRGIANSNALLHAQFAGVTPVVPQVMNRQLHVSGGPFFQGEPNSMRFVSSYSMTEGVRGGLQIVELQVSRGEEGLRLLLTQSPYQGPLSVGRFITGMERTPGSNGMRLLFAPLQPRPDSLIVADRLASVTFSYLRGARRRGEPDTWVAIWDNPQQLPQAIRMSIEPLEDVGRLRPVTIVSEVRARFGVARQSRRR
jgi:general secretion pathway protein J